MVNADVIASFLQSFQGQPFAFAGLVLCSLLLRYLVIAGGAYFLLWRLLPCWFPQTMAQRRHQEVSRPTCIAHEIKYSLVTFLINTALAAGLFILFDTGHTSIYLSFGDRGWAYAGLSLLICFLVHDVWFYWLHRLLHTRWMYKRFHATHHRSTNPTPFSTFAFHPVEALLEYIFLVPLLVWMPIHPAVLLVFLLLTHLFVVNGHFGFEVLPRRVWTSLWGRWLTTGTHHNLHHRFPRGNYALYCKYWDIFFGTFHERTEVEFLLRTKPIDQP